MNPTTTQSVSLVRSTAVVKVSISEIDVPFWNAVWVMVKWSIAAIPAFVILCAVAYGFLILLLALGIGLSAWK